MNYRSDRISKIFIVLLLLAVPALSLASCKHAAVPSRKVENTLSIPSSTKLPPGVTPSNTPIPTPTFTPTPTKTPTPTFIPITPVLAGTQLPLTAGPITLNNAGRLTSLARWGKGNVYDARYTPDGKRLVVGTSTGIYLYNTETYSLQDYIDTRSTIFHIAISLDSKTLAASTFDYVFLYDLENLQWLRTLEVEATGLSFHPNGTILATCTTNRQASMLQLWNVADGTLIQTTDADAIWGITFSPDGTLLASGGGTTQIYNLEGKLIDEWGNYTSGGNTHSVSFSPDGKLLAEGADNRLFIRRVLENGKLMNWRQIYNKGGQTINSVAISPDGRTLAAAMDSGAFLWRIDTAGLIRKLDSRSTWPETINWSPDSKFLAVTSEDRGVEIFNATDGILLNTLNEFTGSINTIDWSPGGQTVASGTGEGIVFLINAQEGSIQHVLDKGYIVNSLSFSPDGSKLAVGFNSDSVKIWNTSNAALDIILDGKLGYGMTSVEYSQEGKILVADIRGENFTVESIQVWHTADWSLASSWSIGDATNSVTDLALSPDGEHIALTTLKLETITIHKLLDGTLVQTIKPKKTRYGIGIKTFTYSPDGKFLATLTEEGPFGKRVEKVWLFRLADGEQLYAVETASQDKGKGYAYYEANALAWSPDGSLLGVGAPDGTVQIRSAKDGSLLKTLFGHTMWVTDVAFSPDGWILASASLDGTIRLWGIK